jgi:hypothetical protein
MRVISRVSLGIENALACRAPTRQHQSTLVEAQMNKFELATAEEIVVETIDEQSVELSLPELDMVGGGNMGLALC